MYTIEYKMGKKMSNILLKNRKGNDTKLSPQKFLCNYVNNELRLRGKCIKVIIGD